MKMPQVTQHSFSQVPKAEIPRSSFDRSHGYKTTFNGGQLIPIFVDEVLPGDTMSLNMTGFVRMSTPLHPIMDNAYINSFFFFVPNRLLWDHWEQFNGQQANPTDSTDFLIPQVVAPAGGWANGSIYDYLGLPTQVAGISVNALFLRAYNLIWNEWFRDENLQNSVVVHTNDGPDPTTDYSILSRGKRHDYFTSCLPWPQKGQSVSIPLGSTAPITADPLGPYPRFLIGSQSNYLMSATDVNSWAVHWGVTPSSATTVAWAPHTGVNTGPGLIADLSSATSATINQLRQAFQVQKLYERDARGGTRYTEIVRSHFGVVSPDARLQRPEYLGGGQSPVLVSQVPQTSATVTGQTPQGSLAAYATCTMSRHGFTKSFTEHGVVLGIIAVRADLTYQQGVDRMWSRQHRFDYYWPALAHIGEQAVLNQEIFAQGTAADANVFGYQERYAEYRYKPSKVTGQFRSNYAQPLDSWHLSQQFTSLPSLNATFIQDNPPFARVVAVPSSPIFIGDYWFQYRCARPMPVFGVPGLIDHF